MKKIAVIFGGISTEHEVSKVSGTSVIENLDKTKYEIYPIYIDKKGQWYEYTKEISNITTLGIDEEIRPLKKIDNELAYLKKVEVVFPVLHGKGGEDGTLQGLLEMLKIPYVGCGVLASSVGMDKVYTKLILEKAKISQTKYKYLQKQGELYYMIDEDWKYKKVNFDEIGEIINENLTYPVFVKPSNSGSSVGVKKVEKKEDLEEAIKKAATYDTKILIEQGINGREIECAVLGNQQAKASCVGEIKPAEEFYSYDAKYKKQESKVMIPAAIDQNLQKEIQKLAIKAFHAIDGKGLSRVDFFIEKDTNKIYVNEINTLPGFTKISMYPKLWEQTGISYQELLDELIQYAMQ